MSRKKSGLRLALVGSGVLGGAVLLAGCGGGRASEAGHVGGAQTVDSLPGIPGQSGPSGLTGPVVSAHSAPKNQANR